MTCRACPTCSRKGRRSACRHMPNVDQPPTGAANGAGRGCESEQQYRHADRGSRTYAAAFASAEGAPPVGQRRRLATAAEAHADQRDPDEWDSDERPGNDAARPQEKRLPGIRGIVVRRILAADLVAPRHPMRPPAAAALSERRRATGRVLAVLHA